MICLHRIYEIVGNGRFIPMIVLIWHLMSLRWPHYDYASLFSSSIKYWWFQSLCNCVKFLYRLLNNLTYTDLNFLSSAAWISSYATEIMSIIACALSSWSVRIWTNRLVHYIYFYGFNPCRLSTQYWLYNDTQYKINCGDAMRPYSKNVSFWCWTTVFHCMTGVLKFYA